MKRILILFFSFLIICKYVKGEKKIIYYGWGTRDTIYVRENWEKMEEMPFDGIGISVAINRDKPTIGNGATGNLLGWNLFGPVAFKYEDFKEAIDDLKVPKWKKFKDNFLVCAVASKGQDYGLNWFDEERWKKIYNNWEIFIRIAKEGNLKGVLIDFEHYDYDCELFCYIHHKNKREDRTFSEYKEIARKRGRDIMKITKKIFPDITIIYTPGYSFYLIDKIEKKCRGKSEEETRYSLLPSFLDGILEESTNKMKIIEIGVTPEYGYRSLYSYTEKIDFQKAYGAVKTYSLLVSEVPNIHWERIKVGFATSLDYPCREWNTEDLSKNYYTPEKFYTTLKNALEICNEYVWLYTGSIKPQFFPRANIPDEYIDAIKKAKEEVNRK
ncbi:MAG: hypothetical protein ACP5OB_07640 [Candidatus Ratteibacteria bacterium]